MWDEITNPFQHLNGATVEILERVSNFIPYFSGLNLSMLILKLNHVGKGGSSRKSQDVIDLPCYTEINVYN